MFLEDSQDGKVDGPISAGRGKVEDEMISLEQLIDILNKQFGTEFKPADQLFLDSIKADALDDSSLREAAMVNSMDSFGYVFLKRLEDLFIERMEQNEDITAKFMNDDKFKSAVGEHLLKKVYEQFIEESK